MDDDDLKNIPAKAIINYLKLFEKTKSVDIILKKFDRIICEIDVTE